MKLNVRNGFKNEKVNAIFDRASRVYHTSKFDDHMKEMRNIHKKAFSTSLMLIFISGHVHIIQFDDIN